MKKAFLTILFLIFFLFNTFPVWAVENPLAVTNNKFGLHILFPEEIFEASKYVNSNGDWGYVTIPLRSNDKDFTKWQTFMSNARSLHIIPIIRIATENISPDSRIWRKPTEPDIVEFANFLNSIDWPIKNRYVIVFNEVNRGDEWGGSAQPAEYAQLLSFATTVFKSKNKDFFIISAGLDNAAPLKPGEFYDWKTYLSEMNAAVPGIFHQIDGFSSHSYPNPAFSQPPSKTDEQSIATFRYEQDDMKEMIGKTLPVFITETGWSQALLTDEVISQYYKESFEGVWKDEHIVAITPFLLQSGTQPFDVFSLVSKTGSPSAQLLTLQSFTKTKGTPVLSVKSTPTKTVIKPTVVQAIRGVRTQSFIFPIQNFFKNVLNLL